MSEQQRLSPGRGSPYCAWCNRSGHNAVPACRDAYEERRASIHPIEKLWREVGLPEYFLGNGGTNDKLYALYDRILCAAQAESMASLSASEVACYRWPEDTTEHRAMRAAFCDGAALYAVTPSPAGEAAYRETARRIAAIREKRLAELRDCLQSIADMPTNEPREPDDADWRFRCLSAVEAAKNTLTIPSTPRESLCECIGGSTYNDGDVRRCDLCGRPVPPAHREDGAQ